MSGASAANKGTPAPSVTLTEAGQKLETEYAGKLASLKAAIAEAVPTVTPGDMAAYEKARENELLAKAKVEEAQKNMGEVGRCQGGVGHAQLLFPRLRSSSISVSGFNGLPAKSKF